MNNKEALEFLLSKPSIREATNAYIELYNLPESDLIVVRKKFGNLKCEKIAFRKNSDVSSWEDMLFHSSSIETPSKKRLSGNKLVYKVEITSEVRKPLSELTSKGLKVRLAPLIHLIETLAVKEDVDTKTIAAYALQLVSSSINDRSTSAFCKQIVSKGTFGNGINFPIAKSTFLLDQMEIGKRKFIELRKIFKSENVILPPYLEISSYRTEITLAKELQFVQNNNVTVGVRLPYQDILRQTISRLIGTLPNINQNQFPLSVKISDGLDGSGSHQIYNHVQATELENFNTKNFILFAFKIISIKDFSDDQIWVNTIPNSHFQIRPVVLISMKENEENVRFLMHSYINPETAEIEQNGIELPQGHVKVNIVRSMFDGKMSGILTGAGGARCQLCTASFKEIHDKDMVSSGFPINRTISAAKEIFLSVEKDEFLSLPSHERFGLTHEPISDIDVIFASPLHSYTCIFRWFMTLIYHLHSGSSKWSPTSVKVSSSFKFVREFLHEKTGLKIDQPSKDGGTSSTGNIARLCFSDQKNFLYWIQTMLPANQHESIGMILNNLSVILRIFSCNRKIDTNELDTLCKETYEYILTHFPWVNITPSLHKVLAHSTELIRDCNDGFGMKDFSEEAVESSNKLIRRYREHLARKNSFTVNIRDIFVRLLSHSDPVLNIFRYFVTCTHCGELSSICNQRCRPTPTLTEQEELFKSLLL